MTDNIAWIIENFTPEQVDDIERAAEERRERRSK